jgi:hypothetical protein
MRAGLRFGDAESNAALDKMEKAFAWEMCVMHLVPIGMMVFSINMSAGYAFLTVIVTGILIKDGLFSVIIAKAFLRPTLQALHSKHPIGGQVFQHRSEAAKRIERTKWTTFAGVTLAVASSSVLYLNIILMVAMAGTFLPSPWLNPGRLHG